MNVKDWYKKEFPTDTMGERIANDVTFDDVFKAIQHGKDVYSVIGVGDSVIRERVFKKLAQVEHISEDVLYDWWRGIYDESMRTFELSKSQVNILADSLNRTIDILSYYQVGSEQIGKLKTLYNYLTQA